MIKTTYSVPSLGLEFDASVIRNVEVKDDYEDWSDFVMQGRTTPPRSKITIVFNNGARLDLSRVEYEDHLYSVQRVVDFELGAHYIVNDGENKWVAVCVEVNVIEGKKLVAVKGYAEEIYQDDKSRFDYEYEEFLPGEKVKELL